MDHSLFIHSPTEGHLGCFQIGAIMNKAATPFCASFCSYRFFIHLDKCIELQRLDHRVRVCSDLSETAALSSTAAASLCIPRRGVSSCCSTFTPAFGGVVFYILVILLRVQRQLVVLTYNSLMKHDVVHLFRCLFASCVSFLVRCPFRSFIHFLIVLFSYY